MIAFIAFTTVTMFVWFGMLVAGFNILLSFVCALLALMAAVSIVNKITFDTWGLS